jgi:hypothetical protein
MCERCWFDQRGDRMPVRLAHPDAERCAWCGRPTIAGIYVRADSADLAGKGADNARD